MLLSPAPTRDQSRAVAERARIACDPTVSSWYALAAAQLFSLENAHARAPSSIQSRCTVACTFVRGRYTIARLRQDECSSDDDRTVHAVGCADIAQGCRASQLTVLGDVDRYIGAVGLYVIKIVDIKIINKIIKGMFDAL